MTTKNGYPIVRIAMPTEGENVENLNVDRFAHAIRKILCWPYPGLTVEVFEHDGTGEDDYSTCDPDIVRDAVSDAFSNPDSYDPNPGAALSYEYDISQRGM